MKKIILILLFIATIAVARWYLEPKAPSTDSIATVKNVDVKEVIRQRNLGTGVEEEEVGVGKEEVILPEKTLATIQDADDNDIVIGKGENSYSLIEGSVINRIGRKVGGAHNGEIQIKESSLQVSKGRILGGKVVLDMTTINALDTDSDDLDSTLKEWFNVDTYPEAEFILLEVSGTNTIGILTMNGISKQISFPSIVIIEDDTVIVSADFALDRYEWDITGGNPAVSEFMEIDLDLTWKQ